MSAEVRTGSPPEAAREGAPAWVVPVYAAGMVAIYLGERVLSTFDSGHWAATGLGLAAIAAATAARFVPTWQAGGERGRIEKLLGVLSLVGVLGLAFYAASTDWGMGKLGLLTAADEKRERAHTILTIGWVLLIFVSILPMLFAEAALYPMRNAERLESRRVRAAAAAGLAIALAAAYGALFVYSAAGTDIRADFSYFKTSDPSDSTRKLIEGLNQPIRVVAFFPEVNPVRHEVEGYLKKLEKSTRNLNVVIADRYLDPKLAKEMKIVQDGVIVIQRGEAKRMVIVGTEMKDAQKNLKTLDRDFQERVYKLLRERRNIYLTVGHGEINDDQRGGEKQQGRAAEILKQLLSKQNYNTKDLGLTQGLATDVPDDADVVMVLGPTQPFAPEEVSALDRYAKRGGKLLMALDPDAISTDEADTEAGASAHTAPPGGSAQPVASAAPAAAPKASAAPSAAASAEKPKTPTPKGSASAAAKGSASAAPSAAPPPPSLDELMGKGTVGTLEALASIVGLQFSPAVLANDKQYAQRRFDSSDRTLLVTNRFSSHPSVSTLSRNSSRAAVLVAGAGSVQRAPGSTAKVDIAVRALSSTFDDVNRNYSFDQGSEKRDSYGIAAAVSEPIASSATPLPVPKKTDKTDANKEIPAVATPNEMRAFVIADADVVSDLVMSNFMANQLLLIDALRWLGGEESFAGEVNTEEDVRIEHTQQQDMVWFYATIFGAPALVLGLGLAFSRRSRRSLGGRK